MQRHLNGGLPDIRLTESNYRGSGALFLQHNFDGRYLYDPHIRDVLFALNAIWGRPVHLASQNQSGEELVYTHLGRHESLFLIQNRQQHLETIHPFQYKV